MVQDIKTDGRMDGGTDGYRHTKQAKTDQLKQHQSIIIINNIMTNYKINTHVHAKKSYGYVKKPHYKIYNDLQTHTVRQS